MIRKIGLFSFALLMFGCGSTSTSTNYKNTVTIDEPSAFADVSAAHMKAGLATPPSCGDPRPAATAERKIASQWSVAQRCIALIEQYEGFEPGIHLGPAGNTLIGFGHTIKPNETFTTITRAQGRELLTKDVEEKAKAVADFINVPVTQNEFSALVCLAYNIGEGKLRGDSTIRALNRQDYRGAADEMTTIRRANGKIYTQLVARRQAECTLFLSP